MPLHNWNKVDAGIFHAFHTTWITEIQNSLNHGLLPPDHYALAEQHMGGFIGDVLTLRVPTPSSDVGRDAYSSDLEGSPSATALLTPPKTSIRESLEVDLAEMARTVTIRHVSTHRIVAMIEIISRANKDREDSVAAIVEKTIRALSQGIHVLLVDLLRPGKFDPNGLHDQIRKACSWKVAEPSFAVLEATLISYQSMGDHFEAFIELPTRSAELPPMPIFLSRTNYVQVPLEETYQRAWNGMPNFWRGVVESDTASPAT
jgi:hypothetical protein